MPKSLHDFSNVNSFFENHVGTLSFFYVLMYFRAHLGGNIPSRKYSSSDSHSQPLNPLLLSYRNTSTFLNDTTGRGALFRHAINAMMQHHTVAPALLFFGHVKGICSSCSNSNTKNGINSKIASISQVIVVAVRSSGNGREMKSVSRPVQEHSNDSGSRCRSFYRCIPSPASAGGSLKIIGSCSASGSPKTILPTEKRAVCPERLAFRCADKAFPDKGRTVAVTSTAQRTPAEFVVHVVRTASKDGMVSAK